MNYEKCPKCGNFTRLTKDQVTLLKRELTPRTLDLKIQGQNTVTEIEKMEVTSMSCWDMSKIAEKGRFVLVCW